MSIVESHVRNATRSYEGEDQGNLIAAFLNGWQNRVEGKRIRELLDSLIALTTLARNKADADLIEEAVSNTKRRLYRYKAQPSVGYTSTGLEFSYVGSGYVNASEFACAHELLQLAQRDRLASLRECLHCGKWFFARFSHQNCCCEQCRIDKYSNSEEWKARRRSKAKEYYWLHKSGKVK